MIKVDTWMPEAVRRLKERFGARVLFIGLQGSYQRGEAREDSDIDILTVFDTLGLEDLDAYRTVLRTLPEGEKACGFTCGWAELAAWPAPELFQFSQDTQAWLGELAPLLPPVTRRDIIAGARAGVSVLHHFTIHMYVVGEEADRAEAIKGIYKSFFHSMQIVEYLRSGVYARTKAELLARLSGDEAELLRGSMGTGECDFARMLAWTGRVMRELSFRMNSLKE